MRDLGVRLTIENTTTTMTVELGDHDVHDVVRAFAYCLLAVGFSPEVVARGFREYE